MEALLYECVGAAYIREFMKERLSSTNETMVQQDTGGRGGGDRCAPQHLLGSRQPCVLLTDRRLCKKGELKVALSPEPPEIHTDTHRAPASIGSPLTC